MVKHLVSSIIVDTNDVWSGSDIVNFCSQEPSCRLYYLEQRLDNAPMFNLTEKLMRNRANNIRHVMTRIAVACLLPGLLIGCISSLQYPNNFSQEYREAVAQESSELSISKLRSIRAPNKDGRIKVQAAIAYYSLSDKGTLFLPEVEKLREITRDEALHQLSEPIQVLLYLGHKADGEENDNITATGKIKNAIDDLCDASADFGLNQRIEDIDELSARTFRMNMVVACAELIKDESEALLSKYLSVNLVLKRDAQTCGLELTGRLPSTARVTAWFECELRQAVEVDMQTLLYGVGV